ncbi:hypothetical protein JCM14076_04510 [Methylosoma difficile]
MNNPTDYTPSKTFMWNTVAFYLVSGIIVEGLIADFADGTLEVLLRTIMAFSSISIFLLSIKSWRLFNQLFTAIFVCENFIMTLAIFSEALDEFMVVIHYEFREYVSISLAVVLVIWYLSIIAYLLRQVFAYKVNVSLMMAFCYFVLTYGIPMMFMDI